VRVCAGRGGQEAANPIDAIDFAVDKKSGLTLEAMAHELDLGLSSREWFVTGKVFYIYICGLWLLFRKYGPGTRSRPVNGS